MKVGWSDLPRHLLISVAKHLVSLEDIEVFSVVCTSWRIAAARAKESFKAGKQFPWLMTFCKDEVEMYSLERRKSYRLPLPHQARNAKSVLTSLGWIFTSYSDYETRLFHPLTGTEIVPPKLSTNNICPRIIKFVLSASPNDPKGYKAFIIHDKEDAVVRKDGLGVIAFWEAGDAAWTRILTTGYRETLFTDMIFNNGRVFAMDKYFKVVIFDMNAHAHHQDSRPGIKAVTVSSVLMTPGIYRHLTPYRGNSMVYVAELTGHLLVVLADKPLCSHRPIETVMFRVYLWQGWELADGTNPVLLVGLGGWSLFLCHNAESFTVNASNYEGCEPDCIYFADDFRRLGNSVVSDSDVGIFRLRDGTSDRSFRVGNKGCLFPPLWLQPSCF